MNTMIVIATNNGMPFLPKLLESLPTDNLLIVDTGSSDPEFRNYLAHLLPKVAYTNGGWSIGAYAHAVENYITDSYMFMHDSMIVKDPSFLYKFQAHDVTAWLSFPMAFDNSSQEAWVKSIYGNDLPDKGIFAPIFYATREALDKIDIAIPGTIDQAHGMERGMAAAFHKAGVPVHFIDEYDHVRLDNDQYETFTKLRPKRP